MKMGFCVHIAQPYCKAVPSSQLDQHYIKTEKWEYFSPVQPDDHQRLQKVSDPSQETVQHTTMEKTKYGFATAQTNEEMYGNTVSSE